MPGKDPNDLKDRHILFVPTYQFQYLLDIINTNLGTVLTIPGKENTGKFQITSALVARLYLAHWAGPPASFDTFEALEKSLPFPLHFAVSYGALLGAMAFLSSRSCLQYAITVSSTAVRDTS